MTLSHSFSGEVLAPHQQSDKYFSRLQNLFRPSSSYRNSKQLHLSTPTIPQAIRLLSTDYQQNFNHFQYFQVTSSHHQSSHNTEPTTWGMSRRRQRITNNHHVSGTRTDAPSVKRRLISTSSSSATSTPASRPPPDVSAPLPATVFSRHHHSQQYRLDLQVRWYRQAYYRKV